MCTALQYKHFFGRNLDLDYSYKEEITITPRNFIFNFKHKEAIKTHFAMIGMAFIQEDYPLYYDATNEHGLSMAGLNFPKNAHYFDLNEDKDNIAPFEFIPWILSQCKNVAEALTLCKKINLVNTPFNKNLPNATLHWIISDVNRAITVESTSDGLKIYENPLGILTNNPPFDKQMFNLNNYKHLSNKDSSNSFSENINFESYSLGMGSIGLPGDVSSQGRFVRISFFKENSDVKENEYMSQFFHLLQSVYQPKGATYVEHSGKYEYTIYTSCIDTINGIYYYKTYNNSDINGIDMKKEKLDSEKLISYNLILEQKINIQN